MANEKISLMTAASALTGAELVEVVQSGVNKRTTTQDIADLGGGGGSSYLVYTALLNQSGTDAPVATVLENTLGFTPTYSYVGAGDYRVLSAAGFTANKTVVFMGLAGSIVQTAYWNNVNTIYIETKDGSYIGDDGWITDLAIEIRVYP